MKLILISPQASTTGKVLENLLSLTEHDRVVIAANSYVGGGEEMAKRLMTLIQGSYISSSERLFHRGGIAPIDEFNNELAILCNTIVCTVVLVLEQKVLEEVFELLVRFHHLTVTTYVTGRSAYWLDLEGGCGSL